VDKFVDANIQMPERTGITRATSEGAGYFSDINRLLNFSPLSLQQIDTTIEVLPSKDGAIPAKYPIPHSKDGLGYLTYSALNSMRSDNFTNTVMSFAWEKSDWHGRFKSEQYLVSKLPPVGGTIFDDYFKFLTPKELEGEFLPILRNYMQNKDGIAVTQIQQVASLGGLDIHMDFDMLDEIGVISTGNYENDTWTARVPVVDKDLIIFKLPRNIYVEEFAIPGSDKYVACVEFPFGMIRVVQTNIIMDDSHMKYLDEAIVVYDSRNKFQFLDGAGGVPPTLEQINAPSDVESIPTADTGEMVEDGETTDDSNDDTDE
jgi:hypothetical protein